MSMFRMAALKSKGDPDLCAAAAMSSISASGGESLPVCRDTLSDGDNAAAGSKAGSRVEMEQRWPMVAYVTAPRAAGHAMGYLGAAHLPDCCSSESRSSPP